jgi:hypothetical protein
MYLMFAPVASVTLNQGDVLVWDNSYTAVQSATGSGAHPSGPMSERSISAVA